MGKDDARLRILNVAGPVFAEKGYDSATVREICQKADVNVAAVNYYFGGKEQLYIETVKWAHRPHAQPEERMEWPPGTPPAEKLRGHIEQMLRRFMSERAPWQRQLMLREVLHPTVACRELVESHFRARFGQLLEILDEILPAEVPEHRRYQIGLSVVGQAVHYHVAGEIITLMVGAEQRAAHYGLDQIAEHIADFSLAALGLAPPLADPGRWREPARSPRRGDSQEELERRGGRERR